MRSVLRSAIAAASVVLVAFSWTPAAIAFENESFGITPFPERANGSDRSSFSIPLETGATFEDAVRIYNRTDEPLRLALYATDAQAALDDTISVGLREEHPEGVGKWIDVSLKSIELDPRDAKTVAFRVKVRSSDPEPELGAIVVENTDRGLAASSVQRLHILVRTVPPNTQTSSTRVRTFLVQSPWVAIALLGLVIAGALVWVGARRARRPRDLVVQPGELEALRDGETADASRPVIRRLGASAAEAPHAKTSVLDRVRASASAARRRDDRPLVDDALLVEVDEGDEHPEPDDDAARAAAPEPARRPKTAPAPTEKRKPAPARSSTPKPKGPARTKAVARRSTPAKRTTAKAKPRSGTQGRATKAKAKPRSKAKRTPEKNFIPLKEL